MHNICHSWTGTATHEDETQGIHHFTHTPALGSYQILKFLLDYTLAEGLQTI